MELDELQFLVFVKAFSKRLLEILRECPVYVEPDPSDYGNRA